MRIFFKFKEIMAVFLNIFTKTFTKNCIVIFKYKYYNFL